MSNSSTASTSIGRGIAIMVLAMLIVPGMDALAKLLSRQMGGPHVAFLRFVGQALVAGGIGLVIGEGRRLIPENAGPHWLRGAFLAVTALQFYSALRTMPLTDALAIAFAEPMILTALSPWALGETVGWRRWAACGVGFVGTLIIIRPSFEIFGLTALLPLGSAFTFAGYHIMTRRLSGQGSLVAAQFTTGVAGTAVLGLGLLAAFLAGAIEKPVALPIDVAGWTIFATMGAMSFVTHGLIIKAFEHAPAAVLAPFGYLEIVSATALSLGVFGDVPDRATWIGMALIVASGLYIVHRERLAGKSRNVPPVE